MLRKLIYNIPEGFQKREREIKTILLQNALKFPMSNCALVR